MQPKIKLTNSVVKLRMLLKDSRHNINLLNYSLKDF